MKIRGFPIRPPATSQIGNSFSKTSVMIAEHCSSDGPLKICSHICFSFVIMYLYPRECNWLTSKRNIVIKIVCKLSFKALVCILLKSRKLGCPKIAKRLAFF